MAALVVAAAEWRREHRREPAPLLVDLESHGRDAVPNAGDVSRMVGWFTSMFPVAIDFERIDIDESLSGGPAMGLVIKRVKEQLRRVSPHTGVHVHSAAQVGFNYLGRLPAYESGDWSVDLEALDGCTSQDPAAPLVHLIDINAVTLEGAAATRLVAHWTWAGEVVQETQVRILAEYWLQALAAMSAHVQSRAGRIGWHTPSDFRLVELHRGAG